MRPVLAAAMLIALALPAAAQSKDFGRGTPLPPEPKYQVDEKKYRSAVDAIPDQQSSNDPWAGARTPASDTTTPEAPKRALKHPVRH